jgi:8-oxo-dGTP pyrophosphatase MutT (NUDIX family)
MPQVIFHKAGERASVNGVDIIDFIIGQEYTLDEQLHDLFVNVRKTARNAADALTGKTEPTESTEPTEPTDTGEFDAKAARDKLATVGVKVHHNTGETRLRELLEENGLDV